MALLRIPSNIYDKMDYDVQRQAKILEKLLRVLSVVVVLFCIDLFFAYQPLIEAAVILMAAGVIASSWAILRRGLPAAGATVLVGGLWALLIAAMFVSDFEGNTAWYYLILVTIIAGMLISTRAGLVIASINTLVGLIYLVAYNNGFLPEPVLLYNTSGTWVTISLAFFAAGGLIALITSSLRTALASAKQHQQVLAQTNQELMVVHQTLEREVTQRTEQLQAQTGYLQAAVEIGRATASILDPQRLMQTAVDMIQNQFNLYYTGLFLVDPTGEWVILRAGTGEAGRRLLSRGHRIGVGSGMIGWAVANAQPRIALDVGRDAVRLATSELPDTRSEAAIPLRSRGRVIGALTIQSSLEEAFGEMELTVFQSLADQLAIALDNANLIEESQRSLQEAKRFQNRSERQNWKRFEHSNSIKNVKFHYGQLEIQSTTADDYRKDVRRKAAATRQPVQIRGISGESEAGDNQHSTLFLPIIVREQVVGVINFGKEIKASNGNGGHSDWRDAEIELLKNITAQLGVALDSARLYQTSQQQAAREQLAGEMTSRIRRTLDIQTVLRTAVEEIQRSLNLPEVVISLTPPEESR